MRRDDYMDHQFPHVKSGVQGVTSPEAPGVYNIFNANTVKICCILTHSSYKFSPIEKSVCVCVWGGGVITWAIPYVKKWRGYTPISAPEYQS